MAKRKESNKGVGKISSMLGRRKRAPSRYEKVKKRADKIISDLDERLEVQDNVLGDAEKAKMCAQIEVLQEVFRK